MDNRMRQLLARVLLGNGMAGQAADTQKLYPQFQKEMMNAQLEGRPTVQFDQWVKQYTGQQSQMPQPPQGG